MDVLKDFQIEQRRAKELSEKPIPRSDQYDSESRVKNQPWAFEAPKPVLSVDGTPNLIAEKVQTWCRRN
ncbi:MAG: hypothetical protein AAFR84_23330 [Pseudomonadota bacterium]